MLKSYPIRVALHSLRPYMADAELTSRLYKIFDVLAKPWLKCWAFGIKDLTYKPLGTLPAAIFFESQAQAARFVENINQQFDIVMAEPLVIEATV